MPQRTSEGQQHVTALAQRYEVSTEAVVTLLQALLHGHGTMAQFDHPELGGRGQWMPGGMVMGGDMFNQALKARVDGLCTESPRSSPLLPSCRRRPPAVPWQAGPRHPSSRAVGVQPLARTGQPQPAGVSRRQQAMQRGSVTKRLLSSTASKAHGNSS
jgi:hypothetical protein